MCQKVAQGTEQIWRWTGRRKNGLHQVRSATVKLVSLFSYFCPVIPALLSCARAEEISLVTIILFI